MMDIKGQKGKKKKKRSEKVRQRCQNKITRGDRQLSPPSDLWLCVRMHCDISFLPNSQREVVDRDNRHCRVERGYKSLWLNLWMIGIRGARGRMCVPCSDHACRHTSPLTTLLSSNRESETGGEMIPNATWSHNHKAHSELLCFYYVNLFFFFLEGRYFFPCTDITIAHYGLWPTLTHYSSTEKTMQRAVMVWVRNHSVQTEDATY